MSGHYSLKNFLRKAQNKDLQRYFKENGIEIAVDWDKLKETKIDPVADAIERLADNTRKTIEGDFLSIHVLNNEAGYQALRQELAQGKNSALDNMDFINAAFLCFFDHRQVFNMARVFQPFFDKGRYWRKVQDVPGKFPANPAQHTKRLAEFLTIYFKDNEGRGRNCQVEHYQRDNRHFFFAFPEDHPIHLIQWERSEMKKTLVHPAFEVVFVYDAKVRSLDTYYEGSITNSQILDSVFSRTILGQDIPERLYNKPVYALSGLKSRSFKFITQVHDGIEKITITHIKVESIMRRSKLTVESDVFGHKGQEALYADMDSLFSVSNTRFPLDMLNVVKAQIAVDFKSEGRKGYKRRRFTISAPSSCTLKHEGEDLIIRRILKDSGVELPPANDASENDADRQVA